MSLGDDRLDRPTTRTAHTWYRKILGALRNIAVVDTQLAAGRIPWIWPLAFFLVYAYLIRDVTVGRLYAFGDYPPFYGWSALETFMSTWHPGMLGYAQPVNTLSVYIGVLTLGGGVLAQNLFYLLLIPGCFVTFWVFLGRFVATEPARTLGATVYAINPVTIGQFTNGGANELLALVGMPLVLTYLWAAIERDAWLPAGTAGAVFGATTIIPWTSFWILAPYATYLLYRTRRTPRRAMKLVAAGILGIVLTIPNLYYLLLRSRSLTSTEALFAVIEYTYADASPWVVVRLAGNRGSYAMRVLGYNDDPALTVGLVIPVVGIIAWRRPECRPFFAAAAGIVGFIIATGHGLTYPLFETVPLLFSLKNPNKLYYALLIALGVLFAVGLEELFTPLRGRQFDVVRLALAAIIVVSLFSYIAPASSDLGLTETRGDEYVIPDEYDTVTSRLDGRVLWVPYSYTTELRLRHAYPAHVGIRGGGVIDGRENAALVESIFSDVANDVPVDDRLRSLGVRYVVIDNISQTRRNSHVGGPRMVTQNFVPRLYGDPARLEARFAGDENYELAFQTAELTVYRVVDAEVREGMQQFEGLHRVYYPETARTRPVGDSLLTNGEFHDHLAGWWVWQGDEGTQTEVVTTDDGKHAAVLTTPSGRTYPIAQEVEVTPDTPYRIEIDAEGPGEVRFVWYDGENDPENKVAAETHPLESFPRDVIAQSDLVSIRIKPNDRRLVVHSADFRASTYPAAASYSRSTDHIPGVTVDGWEATHDAGTGVAVNLDEETAADVDAEVHLVDAETMIDGDLVFDDAYRQDVAVRIENGTLPSAVPEDADVITHETANGTVLDYWVVGEFDETPVTVHYTSFHEDWQGAPGSTQFRAHGWANGFTDTAPNEVRWTGGDDVRRGVIYGWLVCWGIVLVGLMVAWGRSRRTHWPRL